LLETWYQFFHQMPWIAALIGSSRDACRIYLQEFLRHWSYRKDAFELTSQDVVYEGMSGSARSGAVGEAER
jgi:hypothetical protein